ncbi:MAG: hypothetical protein ACJASQ_002978 [Crocinitomicaceae bacterium]|jgi:hypothetical protein
MFKGFVNIKNVMALTMIALGAMILIVMGSIIFVGSHHMLSLFRNLALVVTGLLSFFTVFLFYANMARSQFENKFFMQIQMHRDNISQIEKEHIKGGKNYTPHYFFKQILDEFWAMDSVIEGTLEGKPMDEVLLAYKIEEELLIAKDLNIHLKELTRYNISYLIVFFGLDRDEKTLRSILRATYQEEFIDLIIKVVKRMQKNAKIQNLLELSGYQGVLGHYFRHLFQTVTFAHNSKILLKEEKKDYIKTLRAQLSTFEQGVLLINSISTIGRKWELTCEKEEDKLITTYGMIKNIPAEFVEGVDAKKLYPNVIYEGENSTKNDKLD